MLDFCGAGTNEVLVVPAIFYIGDDDPSAGRYMYKFIVMQVHTDVVDIFPTEGKKHEIAFPKLPLVFSFDLCAHIPRGAWQVFAVYFPV